MIDYADLISLHTPFAPTKGVANLPEAVAAILADVKSKSFATRNAVPEAEDNQRLWLKAALTLRPAGELPTKVIEEMDKLLQAELIDKTITDADTLPRLYTRRYPGAEQVSIWDGDISTLAVDCITNAANAQLLGCFQPFHACIDNVIQNAAGPQLREDCAAIMSHQGHDEATGTAKITRAYNLPSKFILHSVGPIVQNHRPTAAQAAELASCYRSCLNLALEVGVRSVALCGISTGVFGYPADQAAQIALQTVAGWMMENNGALNHIIFNTYGDEATQIYEELVASWT